MPMLRICRDSELACAVFRRFCQAFVCLLFLCHQSPLRADTVTLNSGEVLEGNILSETDDQVEIAAALYHGTITATKRIPKTDIKSIARESVEQKQEKAAYAALATYILNPNQELTKDQYAAGIAAFEKFLAKYPHSSLATDINGRLADWRVEASNVESGKVKFDGKWMTPEERKAQAEHQQKRADVAASQGALQSLQKQLADLQARRGTVVQHIGITQGKLAAAQEKLLALKDTTGSSSGARTSSGGRGDLAGRLTARVTASPQTVTEPGAVSNPEKAQLQTEITSYQQQNSQEQNTLASLDARIKEVQSQIQQSEQDSKLAIAQLSNISAEAKTAPSQETHAPAKVEQVSTPKPEPAPPWYMKVWKWFH